MFSIFPVSAHLIISGYGFFKVLKPKMLRYPGKRIGLKSPALLLCLSKLFLGFVKYRYEHMTSKIPVRLSQILVYAFFTASVIIFAIHDYIHIAYIYSRISACCQRNRCHKLFIEEPLSFRIHHEPSVCGKTQIIIIHTKILIKHILSVLQTCSTYFITCKSE